MLPWRHALNSLQVTSLWFKISKSDELSKFNSIDTLSSNEIIAGGDLHDSEVDHDGVELSVNGSEDEFDEEAVNQGGSVDDTEPGEISSGDEEEDEVDSGNN